MEDMEPVSMSFGTFILIVCGLLLIGLLLYGLNILVKAVMRIFNKYSQPQDAEIQAQELENPHIEVQDLPHNPPERLATRATQIEAEEIIQSQREI